MKKVISSDTVVTVQELIEVLHRWTSTTKVGPDPNTTYVSIDSDAVRATLIEETLTDGSKVFNIELQDAAKRVFI